MVFPAPLAGYRVPPWLVERPGAIGRVQDRNYILPETDMIVVTFTNRSESEFPPGRIVRERGFVFDPLSAATCKEHRE